MPVEMVTFGCRLNIYESEVMRAHAADAKLENTVIVNTCAVTASAEKQARQAIRRLRREKPDARIVVTGCAAQINPDQFSDMPEVSAVLGNEEKLHAARYLQLDSQPAQVNDIMSVKETALHLVPAYDGKARAFIQVQNGCNHRCTFCIIPFGRGNSRSVPMGEIVRHVRALVGMGYNEVVFTGVDISDYGLDLPGKPTFSQMLRRVLAQVPQLARLRLSSIDAVEMDAGFFELLKHEPRLMPHLHVSLQAGDDMVLKRMKRRHLRDDILRFCDAARAARPEIAFGADIIAGFPTESDAMFENTLKLVDEVGLRYLHVFPFSARDGTPAARMPQVPMQTRKTRAAALRKAGEAQLKAQLQHYIGKRVQLVAEGKGDFGHCESFASVKLSSAHAPGSLVNADIIAAHDDHLVAA
jgi:threonylcarbamoyladenosine tRNA methylthiotransferase MtaB